ERRRKAILPRVLKGARVAEVPVGDPQSEQKENLQEPVQYDRQLAEEKRSVEVWRQQNVVEGEQGQRQDGRNLYDAHRIGKGRKSPFVLKQPKDRIDARRIENEARKQQQEQRPAFREAGCLKAHIERSQDRHDRRHEIVD